MAGWDSKLMRHYKLLDFLAEDHFSLDIKKIVVFFNIRPFHAFSLFFINKIEIRIIKMDILEESY